ncbi:hypothetical protein KUCAC02_004771, partial [Chaenocephalus aceratus]
VIEVISGRRRAGKRRDEECGEVSREGLPAHQIRAYISAAYTPEIHLALSWATDIRGLSFGAQSDRAVVGPVCCPCWKCLCLLPAISGGDSLYKPVLACPVPSCATLPSRMDICHSD